MMNLSNLPVNKLINLMLNNKRILRMGVGMAEKSIRSVMGAATHMKIVNGSPYILFTGQAGFWRKPQDEVWGATGKLVRSFLEPLIVKMTKGAEGEAVSILVDAREERLVLVAAVGKSVLIDGPIEDLFARLKTDFAGADIAGEISGLIGSDANEPQFEEADFEEIEEP